MSIKFKIPKMKCMGCVNAIKQALSSIEEIEKSEVDLETKTVEIFPSSIDIEKVKNTLANAGYPPEK